ncbi:uncharacterized protein LOC120180958 [Hibiscus syriacus]|uniref:uncharacterized protein LOC120180958 n=1 Tax=Hibiscus syriacus TaxID=106335 RepID=UPI001920A6D3|nr:uncharacterized protein LOC120180958 [Hibiscus syriacus]
MVQPETTQIDYNHPPYLHPSDTPGTILVSHQLTGVENYNLWSRSMRIALLTKNKIGFVDGTCSREGLSLDLLAQWEHCNAIVLSWILNTVSQELSAGIVFSSNALRVWEDLKERFDKIDGARVYFLHREIVSHSQGTSSISVYYTRLRLLWDEYDAIAPFAMCNCEVSRQNTEHVNQQLLFHFLMGLNDSYSIVRSQILLLKPLPFVNQAYSMLIQEEGQRQNAGRLASVLEPTVFYSRESVPSLTEDSVSAKVPTFTHEQYQQILELLGKDPLVQAATHMAGTRSVPSHHDWILDTGATNHMTFDIEKLSSHVACDSSSFVQLPNGKTTHIAQKGTYAFSPNHILTNELCSGEMKGIGRSYDGLYIFKSSFNPSVGQSVSCKNSCLSSTLLKSDNGVLWHARLGHTSLSTLNKMSQLHSSLSNIDHVKSCGVCLLAKQNRLPFPMSDSRESSAFSLIHIDLWGAYRVSKHSEHRYFLTVVDDHTRMTWAFLLRLKSDAFITLKQFFAYVGNHFSAKIKTVRSDNGWEFFSTEVEPKTYHEAACDERWVEAMQHEIHALKTNVERFKARLVAKGYRQCEGIDFHDTFSPAAKQVTVRTIIAMAAMFGGSSIKWMFSMPSYKGIFMKKST